MIKRRIDDLAIFGGMPAFDTELPVGQVNLPPWDAFESAFRGIFARGYYTNHGPLVAELERRVAESLGVEHAMCVTNGTIALMIAARALELAGEVIVPAFTFPGTVQALSWAGLTPVFADVEPDTHALSARTAAPLIGPRTSAVLGVHLWGRTCDPDGLGRLCEERGLALFYDAAHAFGCTHAGRPIGSLGRLEAFSFHATKIVSGGEGGCLTTNDDELARRVRTIRNFHQSETFCEVGLRINGKMSEAQAAMAMLSLDRLEANVAHNRAVFACYREGARDWRGVRLVDYPSGERNSFQYAVLAVDEDAVPDRDLIVDVLRGENVLARRYFHPGIHRMPPYDDMNSRPLPVTETLCRTLLQIPLGPTVTPEAARRISALIAFITEHGATISRRLAEGRA